MTTRVAERLVCREGGQAPTDGAAAGRGSAPAAGRYHPLGEPLTGSGLDTPEDAACRGACRRPAARRTGGYRDGPSHDSADRMRHSALARFAASATSGYHTVAVGGVGRFHHVRFRHAAATTRRPAWRREAGLRPRCWNQQFTTQSLPRWREPRRRGLPPHRARDGGVYGCAPFGSLARGRTRRSRV